MKSKVLLVLCLIFATNETFAQYLDNKLNNSERNINGNPQLQVQYSVDTSVNHVNFGSKKNKRSFVILFSFRPVQDPKTSFTFSKSQIKGTNMTQHSGVTGIELTSRGFEVTYNPHGKQGLIDDYVVIHTENGDIMLRLTGEIIDNKKKSE